MARSLVVAASAVLLVTGTIVSASSCHLVLDLEEKTPTGAGGAGGTVETISSSSGGGAGGSGGAAGMGGSGGGMTLPVGEPAWCAPGGAPVYEGCANNTCVDPGTPFDISSCHCGGCDHHCGGLTCASYLCEVKKMASPTGYSYGLTTNGSHVFFASFVEPPNDVPTSSIWRVDFDADGSMMPHLLGVTPGRVKHLVADCNDVYFASIGQGPDQPGGAVESKLEHFRVDADGSIPDPKYVVPTLFTPEGVDHMVVDGRYLYWVENMAPGGKYVIRAWDKQNSPEDVISLNDPIKGLALNGGYLYWIMSGTTSVAQIMYRAKVPSMPGQAWSPETVATNIGFAKGLAVDDTSTYWIETSGAMPTIKRGPKEFDANAVYVGIAQVTDPGEFLVVDDNYVYFMQNASIPAEIWRANKNVNEVTPPQAVLTQTNSDYLATQFVADSGRIYWTSVAEMTSQVQWVAK